MTALCRRVCCTHFTWATVFFTTQMLLAFFTTQMLLAAFFLPSARKAAHFPISVIAAALNSGVACSVCKS